MDTRAGPPRVMAARTRPPVPFVELRMPTWRLVLLCISLCFGLFLSLLDTSIVATALYTIGKEMDCLQSVTWVALSYTLSYVGCTVIFARLGDVLGRRNAYLAAGIVFLGFSIGCGFCRSLWQLIVCRALQGVGGSGLYSLTLIILPEISPLRKRKFIGTLAGLVIAISGVLGPVLGGLITRYTTWRWIFWINAPIGIMPLILFCIAWPKVNQMRHAHRRPIRELDVIGGFLLIAASVLFVFAFQQGGIDTNAWDTAIFIMPLVISGMAWTAFFVWEVYISRHFKNDTYALMFPLRLMKKRIYIAGVISTLLIGFPYYIVIYSLPLYFQVVYGKDPLGAGLALLPLLGSSAVSTMLGGLISGKKDHTFATLLTGNCLMTIGCGLLSTLSTDLHHEARAYAFQIFIGLGFGLTVSTVSLLATVESERKDHAVAQGIVAQVRVLGGSIGIAVSTAILNMSQRAQLTGVLTNSELATLAAPTVTLTLEQMLAFRNTSAAAFTETLRVCIAVAGLGALFTLGTWSRHPVDMSERRKALAVDAITAVQDEERAAEHKAATEENKRQWKQEQRSRKQAEKARKKAAKKVAKGSPTLSGPSAEASPVLGV
ncbi:hypothetical protein MMC30_004275 [Trapelia coarctata]|nr:hypothetical protein [Trapelia coarctata]